MQARHKKLKRMSTKKKYVHVRLPKEDYETLLREKLIGHTPRMTTEATIRAMETDLDEVETINTPENAAATGQTEEHSDTTSERGDHVESAIVIPSDATLPSPPPSTILKQGILTDHVNRRY